MENLLIPPVLFFALGFIATLLKSDLRFPADLGQALSIYLLAGIGISGGMELHHAELSTALRAVGAALALGFGLPFLGYLILTRLGHIDGLNAAAIAAHYGSVSTGTFLTAVAFLNSSHIPYDTYPVIMLAIMESPAIIIGIILANLARQQIASANASLVARRSWGELIGEALTNGSVVLLFGTLIIGSVANTTALEAITPFFDTIFMGALCLFLIDMGISAASRVGEIRRAGFFLLGFGLAMPLIGGLLGALIGHYVIALDTGGTMLVAVLGASASYIAVPPAMRMAVPEANPSFYLTLALGITFPFNVLIGIPLYYRLAQLLG